jgi:hypothetical protein
MEMGNPVKLTGIYLFTTPCDSVETETPPSSSNGLLRGTSLRRRGCGTAPQTVLFPNAFDRPLVATYDQAHARSDGGAILL